jgi:hypothetical protein
MKEWLIIPGFFLSQGLFAQGDIIDTKKIPTKPFISHQYLSNPSVRVFNNKVHIYCSLDLDAGIAPNKTGDQFAMRNHWLYTLTDMKETAQELGPILDIREVPWASRQLGAPDIAFHKGTYYLYFSLKDKNDIYRIGVATSDSANGPFKPEKNPISLAYSTDPCVFQDDDGTFYLYFGGIKNGQLHLWENNIHRPNADERVGEQYALLPRIAKLSADMKQLAEQVREVKITDANGALLEEKDNRKRFGEATWVHKYNGKYYLSYSTGDTHLIAYAIGNSPYGPFTFRGILSGPLAGNTSHHSIINIKGKWYLFYHDAQLSRTSHLRNIYVTPIIHLPNGDISLE